MAWRSAWLSGRTDPLGRASSSKGTVGGWPWLAAGSYGRSVRSGQAIPDERLQVDLLAELTVEEAATTERGALEQGDDAVGLVSAGHPFEVLTEADITPEEEYAAMTTTSLPGAEPGHPHRA
jgi:hypothetical protein